MAYFISKRYYGDAQEEDIISVRHTLVAGGYAGCVGIMLFTILLVLISTPSLEQDSRYISEGMESHCGWSVVLLGSCSFLISICQLLAGAHMNRHSAIAFSVLQLVGWNVVLGVVDTGWNMHYVGLSVFLISNISYHWIASHDENYGNELYRWANKLTMLFTICFGVANVTTRNTVYVREAKACAVSLEFVLTFSSMIANICLVRGLDGYQNIHMVFERRS